MKNDAITTLHDMLAAKETRLSAIEVDIRKLINERSIITTDIQALKHTLKVLGEKNIEPKVEVKPRQIALLQTYQGSIPDVAYNFLQEANHPLSGNELVELFKAKGRDVARTTLVSGLYREIKLGKRFKLFGAGRFGLIEWPANKGGD